MKCPSEKGKKGKREKEKARLPATQVLKKGEEGNIVIVGFETPELAAGAARTALATNDRETRRMQSSVVNILTCV